jgi:hypothetical protein
MMGNQSDRAELIMGKELNQRSHQRQRVKFRWHEQHIHVLHAIKTREAKNQIQSV